MVFLLLLLKFVAEGAFGNAEVLDTVGTTLESTPLFRFLEKLELEGAYAAS